MEHVHDIVEDTENEAESIDNNLNVFNKELSCNNNISISGGVKIVNVKGRYVVQDLLIQIGTDEIGKVTKEEKSNIIEFNDEEERMKVSNKVIESWKKKVTVN
jgi:hypothetical protein